MQVKLFHSGKNVEVKEVGSFNPKPYVRERLQVGETGGTMTANIKSPLEVKMGDTITDARHPSPVLAGFKENSSDGFQRHLPDQPPLTTNISRANLAKLQLNDSGFCLSAGDIRRALALVSAVAFLGLLHLEIVQERLRREYGMDIIATYPSVIYRVKLTDGTIKEVDNPPYLPEVTISDKIEEPMVKAFVICPTNTSAI